MVTRRLTLESESMSSIFPRAGPAELAALRGGQGEWLTQLRELEASLMAELAGRVGGASAGRGALPLDTTTGSGIGSQDPCHPVTPTSSHGQAQRSHPPPSVSHSPLQGVAAVSTPPRSHQPQTVVLSPLATGSPPSPNQSLRIQHPSPPHADPLHTITPMVPATPTPSVQPVPRPLATPRASLMEKHARHIRHLTGYYEAALESARTELDSQWRSWQDGGQRSQDGGQGEEEWEGLRRQLEEAERTREKSERQMLEAQNQLEEWRELSGALRGQLASARDGLAKREVEAAQMQTELRARADEARQWGAWQEAHLAEADQLLSEVGALRKYRRELELGLAAREATLADAMSEAASLREELRTARQLEVEYKSTVARLEEETRHLQHINNRLHSQTTHYNLGYSSPCPQPTQPDEEMFACTPPPLHSPLPTHHTVTRSSVTTKTAPHTFTHSPVTSSPLPTLSSPHTLTRRKWLEPSDPGLIMGGHSSMPRPLLSSSVIKAERRGGGTGSAGGDGDNVIKALRSGGNMAGEASSPQGMEETMTAVEEAESRLAGLLKEREKLEAVLQRVPVVGGRVTHLAKQQQLQVEERMDEVVQEIGSVRMILRAHHAL